MNLIFELLFWLNVLCAIANLANGFLIAAAFNAVAAMVVYHHLS